MRKILFLLLLIISFSNLSFAKEVPFTQEDRERLIRLEVKVEKLEARVDGLQKQIDGLQKQIDELRSDFRTYMSITLGALFTIIVGIIGLIGFVLWDRRTALSPVIKKTRELEDKCDIYEKILKELARENPQIAEALKRFGLL